MLGGALDLMVTEVFPSFSGSVVLFLKFTCTDTARMWANGSATCGLCWGHPGTSKSREILGFPQKPCSPSPPVPLYASPYPGAGFLCLYILSCASSPWSLCHLPQTGRMVMEQAFLWVWHAQLRQEGTPASGKPQTFVTCSKAKSVAQNSLWKYFNYP